MDLAILQASKSLADNIKFLLDAFLKHWNIHNNKKDKMVPIT